MILTFIDISASFRLGDGSINDGYLQPDVSHLTRDRVNKLAQKLEFRTKTPGEGVTFDHNQALLDPNGYRATINAPEFSNHAVTTVTKPVTSQKTAGTEERWNATAANG